MTWKKNWFSILLWIGQLIFVALLLTGTCGIFVDKFQLAEKFHIIPGNDRLVWISGTGILFGLVLLVVFLLVRLVRERMNQKLIPGAAKAAIEGLMFVGVITGGVLLRMHIFPSELTTNAYFELASVTAENHVTPLAHGILYVYILLLHALFLLVGNQIVAGIILQLVLHFLASIFIYAAVRKISGAFTAIWTLAFLMFSPYFVNSSLCYSPESLFLLLFGIALLIVAGVFNKVRKSTVLKWFNYVSFVLAGIILSALIYLDALGIILVVTCVGLLTLKNVEPDVNKNKNGFLAFLLILIGAIGGLLGIFYADALSCGSTLNAIAGVWEWLFAPEMINISYTYYQIFEILSADLIFAIVLFIGLVFSTYAFWIHPKKEKQNLLILLTLSGVLMSYVCSATGNMNRSFIAYLALIILAGKGITTLFEKRTMEAAEEVFEINETEEYVEQEMTEEYYEEPVSEEIMTEESSIEGENMVETVMEDVTVETVITEDTVVEPVKEIKFIENPLPLPKKHVKKKMDFAIEPEEDQLSFDIDVPDDDDFDL